MIPKTIHDVRTARSIVTQAAPANESMVFLRLHRLASEKLKLEREIELWLSKKRRIEKRLAEIQQQMERLCGQSACATGQPRIIHPEKASDQVILEY